MLWMYLLMFVVVAAIFFLEAGEEGN